MKLFTTVLASLVTALLLVGPAFARDQDFVRMFLHLPAFEPPDVALANHGACTPAPCGGASTEPMVDPNLDVDNSPRDTPAGFTYFGQFVDHDVTRDENPLPATTFPIDQLNNVRNAKLDLDSVYGPGSVRDREPRQDAHRSGRRRPAPRVGWPGADRRLAQ